MESPRTILPVPKIAGFLNRLRSSRRALLSDASEPAVADQLVAMNEEQYGNSMPPRLRKLLLPLLLDVATSPYLIADSIGMWHMGEERFMDAALHLPAHTANETAD
jgi:hypothetical protein